MRLKGEAILRAAEVATEEQLREARGWIADCEWENLAAGEERGLTALQVVRGVNRAVPGGWDAFVRDCV